jgi:hypothetical protein
MNEQKINKSVRKVVKSSARGVDEDGAITKISNNGSR